MDEVEKSICITLLQMPNSGVHKHISCVSVYILPDQWAEIYTTRGRFVICQIRTAPFPTTITMEILLLFLM